MTLLVLMYHRARAGRHGNPASILDAHFAHIAAHYHPVLPGEPLAGDRLNVCLSFDDGFYDFRAVALPLLQRHGLRALLGIAPGLIREKVDATHEERMNAGTRHALAHPGIGAFCTWGELQETVRSGHVQIAAHGYTHGALDEPGTDAALEVDTPRTVLASRLGQPVDSFVFPYGKFSRPVLTAARGQYRHLFRIGGALNRGWDGPILYRVGADRMATPTSLFSAGRLLQYRTRNLWNRLRQR
jgi:peptidoglycan/xylan/chitin deacetylase (PgdA/CDA1 family)